MIILIVYYYTWDKWTEGERKRKHIMLGVALSIALWVTMVIITGVLAAKLTPGRWIDTFSFWNAFLNPTYFPSLGFRMFLAIMLAISLVSFFIRWRIKDKALRTEVFRVFAFWGASIVLPLAIHPAIMAFAIHAIRAPQLRDSSGRQACLSSFYKVLHYGFL
ncbi:hypothetical protein LSPH24S_03474 [Lysinibacillus sphaericus]